MPAGVYIIDEALQYPQLFSILRSVIDENRPTADRIILTGSNSPDIVKGLSESLAGRIATVELSPSKTAELNDQKFPQTYKLITQSNTVIEDVENLQVQVFQSMICEHWM